MSVYQSRAVTQESKVRARTRIPLLEGLCVGTGGGGTIPWDEVFPLGCP